ncbi:stationary phase inducible protein CsiE [Shimwellia blattae]|nr:stationary phase inducible protein CsiE [Shimwellia blattae]VEC21638.1 stationary phase inducible protein CsiE [Shimwellia blattae]
MTVLSPTPSALSSPQRRCHLLLLLYLPGQTVTPEVIGRVNGVDDDLARKDIAETAQEIQRFHRLSIVTQQDGSYRLEGSPLDNRLCLFHWLRRAIRLCPHFVSQQFIPTLKTELKRQRIATVLYDDTNLRALINLCSQRLARRFDQRDSQFLALYLQYCLLQHQSGLVPQFSDNQQRWARTHEEFSAAADIVRHWRRRAVDPQYEQEEHLFLTVLLMLLHTPDPRRDTQLQARRLTRAIQRLVDHFRQLSAMSFSDEQGLANQLYTHLSQALHRRQFGIGIDNPLQEDIRRLYPRLIRTTREAMRPFEQHYGVSFPECELGLIAVIFGAWLMQEKDLHEKQVVMLTGNNSQIEQALEQQIRELTLLPLNIKYLTLHTFQREGAPRDAALIVTPYATTLPLLFAPPLIHASLPLAEHQQRCIRAILER